MIEAGLMVLGGSAAGALWCAMQLMGERLRPRLYGHGPEDPQSWGAQAVRGARLMLPWLGLLATVGVALFAVGLLVGEPWPRRHHHEHVRQTTTTITGRL